MYLRYNRFIIFLNSTEIMKVFLKYNKEWLCFKGENAIERARNYGKKLLLNNIRSMIYINGSWIPVTKY